MNLVTEFSLDYLFFKWIIRFDCYLIACWHRKWKYLSVRDNIWTNVPNGPVNFVGYIRKTLISFSLKLNKSPFSLIDRALFRISSLTPSTQIFLSSPHRGFLVNFSSDFSAYIYAKYGRTIRVISPYFHLKALIIQRSPDGIPSLV